MVMRMKGEAVAAALLLLVACPVYAQCSKDTDCKGDRICVKGACTSPEVAPAKASSPLGGGTSQVAPDTVAPLTRAEVRSVYEKGDATRARDEAERAGDRDLAVKLGRFLLVYKAGVDAMNKGAATEAVTEFEAALQIDGQITTATSEYASSIRRSLARVWVSSADREARQGNLSGARSAIAIALKYDPSDPDAAALLARINVRPGAAQPAASAAPQVHNEVAEQTEAAPRASGERAPLRAAPRDVPQASDGTSTVGVKAEPDRFRLLQERQNLMANMPSPVWSIVSLSIAVPLIVFDAIMLAVNPGLAVLWGVLLVVAAVVTVVDVIFIAIAVSRRSEMEARVAEIDRQLALARPRVRLVDGLATITF